MNFFRGKNLLSLAEIYALKRDLCKASKWELDGGKPCDTGVFIGAFESMNIIGDHAVDSHFQFPPTSAEYHLLEIGGARQPELPSAFAQHPCGVPVAEQREAPAGPIPQQWCDAALRLPVSPATHPHLK